MTGSIKIHSSNSGLNKSFKTFSVIFVKQVQGVKNFEANTYLYITYICLGNTPPPGGEELPIMAYTGRLRQEGVSFTDFVYMKGVGISLVEVYKRVGKSVIWVCEGAKRANRMFHL